MGWPEEHIALLNKYGKQYTASELSEMTGKSTGAIYSYAQRHNISLSKTVQSSEFECLSRHRLTLPPGNNVELSLPYGVYLLQEYGHAYGLRIEVPMKSAPIYKEVFNFTRFNSLKSCLKAAKKRQKSLGETEWGKNRWYHIQHSGLLRKMPKSTSVGIVLTRPVRPAKSEMIESWNDNGEIVSIERSKNRSSLRFIATTNIYPDGLNGKKKRLAKSFCIFKYGFSKAYSLAKKEQDLQRENWFEKCQIHND